MGWGCKGAAGDSDLACGLVPGVVWLFMVLWYSYGIKPTRIPAMQPCVCVQHPQELNSAPQINTKFPKFWMLAQELLWMGLKLPTRLDDEGAGSALHRKLARAAAFGEPTVLPCTEWGRRATNRALSVQTVYY